MQLIKPSVEIGMDIMQINVNLFWTVAYLRSCDVSVPQVNRREVVYIQTAIESVGWEAMDSMTFSVASPPTSLDSQTFKIDISYKNTRPEHNTVLLANTGINKILHAKSSMRVYIDTEVL